MKTSIYALCEPGTENIRYIGKTKNNIYKRFNEHLKDKSKTLKVNWIKSLLKKGEIPELIVLEECEEKDWEWTELYWISQCKCWGFELLNIQPGGTCVDRYIGYTKVQEEHLKNVYENYSNRYSKKCYIMNIETQEITECKSIRNTAILLNSNEKEVSGHLNGSIRLSVKGNVMGFSVEDCNEKLEKLKKSLVERYEAKRQAVYCVTLDRSFNSVLEAAKELNLDKSSISKCCKGKQKTTGGYMFKYV